jgi:hypothetical protein
MTIHNPFSEDRNQDEDDLGFAIGGALGGLGVMIAAGLRRSLSQ